MPQVLLKTNPQAGVALQAQGRTLAAAHEAIAATLRSQLGFNHAELLAAPRVARDGSISWVTGLVGTVTPAAEMADAERDRLLQRAERLIEDILGLARKLRAEGAAASAELLELAVQTPGSGADALRPWLYGVGGKPVLAMWGHAAPGTAVAGSAPAAAAVPAAGAPSDAVPAGPVPAAPVPAAAAPAAVAPSAPAPATVAATSAARPFLFWLLWGLLALALVAALLFGLKRCAPAGAVLDDEITRLDARNRELEDELARQKRRDPRFACVREEEPAPPPPGASVSEATPPPLPPVASAPAPAPPSPLEQLKKRVADAGSNCERLTELLKREPLLQGARGEAGATKQEIQRLLQSPACREKSIREAKNLCPGQRPPELAPEMVVVFDGSGSMRYSLEVSDEQIRRNEGAAAVEGMMKQFGLRLPPGQSSADQLMREPTRITVARRATQAVVQRVPSDMSVGLVMVDECPAARPQGFFPPGRRGELLSRIQGIEPRKGTPLADGIAKAAQMVDGTRREALIVVVSDGTESCNGDPCAVAAQLKASKPHVKVNVVDITGTGAGNCVAQATGGKVFTARNADEVAAMTRRAAQEALGPEDCRKP